MSKRLKVAITTLGCKANQYDSSAIEEAVAGGGCLLVNFAARADAYIINTCTVTHKTDYQSRQLIRRAKKTNPEATVIVTGCYAEVSGEEIGRIEGVDHVLGNGAKAGLLDYIMKKKEAKAGTISGQGVPMTLRALKSSERTRATMKIQDGCDMRCTYCIIPKARGASVSRSRADVESEIDAFVEGGYKEIVLTGIHLGAYGSDLAEQTDLVSILKLIKRRNWPCRFRLSSLDPDEVTPELIELLGATDSICKHMHLPLQSGSAEVLRKMGRRYTPEIFRRVVERLYKEVPGISIGTDVIAGFPGETALEFGETYDLISELPISYLHVFPYSARRGTPAAGYGGHINPRTIKERSKALRELDAAKRGCFYKGFVGHSAEVLVETLRDRETGLPKGKSGNYIPVLLSGAGPTPYKENMMVNARLTGLSGSSMIGAVNAGTSFAEAGFE